MVNWEFIVKRLVTSILLIIFGLTVLLYPIVAPILLVVFLIILSYVYK